MSYIINPYRFSSVDATLTFTDNGTDASDLTTYTFASKSVGTASATRKVIVWTGALAGGAVSINSVTVGGSGATAAATAGASSQSPVGIYIIDYPTGTTANVVVTLSGGGVGCWCSVWAAYDLLSSTATDTATAAAVDPLTDTIDVSAGGVVVGGAVINVSTSFTWTGATEVLDSNVDAARTGTAAGAAYSTIQTGMTITADQATGTSLARFIAASFR